MTYLDIVPEVAEELGLPESLVRKTYKNFWVFTRQHLSSLPIKDIKSEEELSKYKTSVNIPSIGKIYCTYDIIASARRKYDFMTKLTHDKDKED